VPESGLMRNELPVRLVPVMGCPTARLAMLNPPEMPVTAVMVLVPLVMMPENVTFAAAVIPVITEPNGIPTPLMTSPTTAFVDVSCE